MEVCRTTECYELILYTPEQRDRRSGSIVLSDPAPEECLGFIGSETYGWEGKIEELMGPIYALAQSLQDLDDKEHALFNEVESLYQEALKQQKAGTEMLNSHLEAIDEWMGFYKARMMELDLPRGQD
ncbi:hypothetical protein SARC_01817 [Sphaeroforma arctica JP610]|uniref:Uncharacterized protein n=1 Tax=Sphaeroforma arctica JP610 TaxID=667725 RepID=A0A0L0GAU1_9EUKA|nr:hypothetical protein SARC_01817 [Sphaeroforma arctica JP610]KNC86016.1 hypothetical protein SARC_01817 [Sphaeroforma arctica JP610]|eukprot:XP_014159918.1 hypothetical protein SARC_01817 [Sphaeroforma arctica JP610]